MSEGLVVQIRYWVDQIRTLQKAIRRKNRKLKRVNAELAQAKATIERMRDCVVVEEVLPGDMPDEMWQAIKGDRDLMCEVIRAAVAATKESILERMDSNVSLTNPKGADNG